MPKLTDREILTCYTNALKNGGDWVVFNKDATAGLKKFLGGYSQKSFKELLCRFVVDEGGEIKQVVETRPEYVAEWEFYYKLLPTFDGVRMFIETRLEYFNPDDPDDPKIHVVNIHPD